MPAEPLFFEDLRFEGYNEQEVEKDIRRNGCPLNAIVYRSAIFCQIMSNHRKKMRSPKGGKKDGATATERKERWAALPPQMALILYLARRQQEYYSGGEISGSYYVFRTRRDILNGVLRKPREAEPIFHVQVDSFDGCPDKFRLHDLRHTFISLCLNGGVNT